MKHYLVNSDVKFVKLQANTKVHKSEIPLRTIVNVGNHSTANMEEIVEHELAENVRSLNKLSTINQPLPNNCLMFCIDAQALYPSVPRKKRAKQPKKLSRKDQIKTYQLMKYSE
jgi:hypothetical protein